MGKHLAPRDRMIKPNAWIVVALVVGSRRQSAAMAAYSARRAPNPVTAITQIFVPTPQQVFGRSNLLVLVEGLDYDYTPSDEEFSKNSRSDVIWAVNLDFANKRIYQLSIPRDMVATMPNGTQAKINQAQSDGGVKEAKSVIAGWLGIPDFDRYVILRIDATKAFITAIGGVNVDVKSSNCLQYNTDCKGDALDYDDTWGHLHIHLKEGMQHLNGEQAVAYMRFRHDWCSDPCRIKRQQQVLHAMVDKVKGDKFNTFVHLGNLLSVFRTYVQTDFTDPELVSIANYYQGIPSAAIVSIRCHTPATSICRVTATRSFPTRARAQSSSGRCSCAPPTPRSIARHARARGDTRLDAARRRRERQRCRWCRATASRPICREAGFTIGAVGNADRSDYTATEIHEHSTVTFAGARVRAALPAPLREAAVVHERHRQRVAVGESDAASDVTVIVGSIWPERCGCMASLSRERRRRARIVAAGLALRRLARPRAFEQLDSGAGDAANERASRISAAISSRGHIA